MRRQGGEALDGLDELLWTDLMMAHRAMAELEELRGNHVRSIEHRKEALNVAMRAGR